MLDPFVSGSTGDALGPLSIDGELAILFKVMLAKLGGGIVVTDYDILEARDAPSPIIEKFQDPFMMKVRFPE